MGGFFGVVAKHNCVVDLFYGTDYHSHLGTRCGGMAVCEDSGRIVRKIHNISNTQFRSKFDDDISKLAGKAGIGVISDGEHQPMVVSGNFGNFAIATVGRINNIDEIARSAFDSGHCHFSESNDGELNPTEVVAMLICRQHSLIKGIEYAQKIIDGSCSMLILHKGHVFAARDRYGRTPVIIGQKPGCRVVTMESTAFPNLDCETVCELGPGEIVELTSEHVICRKEPGNTMKICTFFWVYYGYPSSTYEGVNAEVVRYRNGKLLAARDAGKIDDIDSICGVPDSGISHAIGYANAAGKPYRRSFVKYTPTWARSFTPTNQEVRNLVAKMKLIPVHDQLCDKKLLFCDDSIVRGTQLKDTVVRIFDHGAKEVHMRSACPPLLFGCRFLNFSRSRSELDLAARRAIAKIEGVDEPTDDMIRKYLVFDSPEYNMLVEEIRKSLKLDSLKFQKLEDLIEAVGIPKEKLCTYCWNGKDVEDEAPEFDSEMTSR